MKRLGRSLLLRTINLTPEKAFTLMALPFGLMFLLLTPPFQVPDEAQHFYSAFHLSEFGFRMVRVIDRDGTGAIAFGAWLPKSLAATVDQSDLMTMRSRRNSKVSVKKILGAFEIPLNPGEREYLPIAPYPPVGYISQSSGIFLGRVIGLPPLALFYLGRLGSFVAWFTLTYFAIQATPVLKWTYFLLAMMPMTLYMAASNSCDGFVIGTSFLMSATLLRWIYEARKGDLGWQAVISLSLLAVGIALSKAVYLGWIFLLILVPSRKFRSHREYYVALCAVVLIAVAMYQLWTGLVDWTTMEGPSIELARYGVGHSPSSNVSPSKQWEFLLSQPLTFTKTLANTFWSIQGFRTFLSFFGVLGWMDTALPFWLPFCYMVALIASSSLSIYRYRIGLAARLVSAAIFGGTMLVMIVLIYVGWDSVGAPFVDGFQGRYLIPLGPALSLLIHLDGMKINSDRTAAAIFTVFVGGTSMTAIHTILQRFY